MIASPAGAREPVPWAVLERGTNDFEAVVFERWPLLGKVRRTLVELGVPQPKLSGTGAALFAPWDPGTEVDLAALAGVLPAGTRVLLVWSLPRRSGLEPAAASGGRRDTECASPT